MKKTFIMLMLLFLVFCENLSLAENQYNTGWTKTFNKCVCKSEQYTYTAAGYYYLTSWSPEWYEITKTDNGTGQMQNLTKRFFGDIHMIPWQNGILIINEIKQNNGLYHIDFWELQNDSIEPIPFYSKRASEQINDLVLYNDGLVLLTDHMIYHINLYTFQEKPIYNTNYEITNYSHNNRSFIYNNSLIISDNHGRIVSIDLLENKPQVLVDNYCNDETGLMDYGEIYGYIIVRNNLYYYNACLNKTVILNIENGLPRILFDGKTSFKPDGDERIIVMAYKENYNTFAGTYVDSYILTIIKCIE